MSFIMSDASKSKVESLERRIALGAPLALTDEGLMVSAPGEDGTEAWLDPGINEPLGDGQSDLFADAPPVPFAAKSDAFQPAEQENTSTMMMGSTYSRATVTSLSSAAESIYTNGSARFAVSSMTYGGAPLPTSATLNWVLEGTATAGADYTGPLTAGTVTFALNSGSGDVDVPFTVVDDALAEPTETIIARLTGGSVNNGATFQIGSPDRQTATLGSDDATAEDVEIDLTRGGATAKIGEGTATVPEGTALIWKVGKVTTGAAATSATGAIKITKSTPGNIGQTTDNEYSFTGDAVPPAGTSRVYDVEIVTDGGGQYKVKIKVTVKN